MLFFDPHGAVFSSASQKMQIKKRLMMLFPLIFVLGVLQFFSMLNGLEIWFELHWVVAIPLAILLDGMPVVGTVISMFGAVDAWGWSWLMASLLFLGPLVILGCVFLMRRGWKA